MENVGFAILTKDVYVLSRYKHHQCSPRDFYYNLV